MGHDPRIPRAVSNRGEVRRIVRVELTTDQDMEYRYEERKLEEAALG